jgi:hypothetical protein
MKKPSGPYFPPAIVLLFAILLSIEFLSSLAEEKMPLNRMGTFGISNYSAHFST